MIWATLYFVGYAFAAYYVVAACIIAILNATADKRNPFPLRDRIIEPLAAPFVLLAILAMTVADLFRKQPRMEGNVVTSGKERYAEPKWPMRMPTWDAKAEPEYLPNNE